VGQSVLFSYGKRAWEGLKLSGCIGGFSAGVLVGGVGQGGYLVGRVVADVTGVRTLGVEDIPSPAELGAIALLAGVGGCIAGINLNFALIAAGNTPAQIALIGEIGLLSSPFVGFGTGIAVGFVESLLAFVGG
jgi:hypothetical protein